MFGRPEKVLYESSLSGEISYARFFSGALDTQYNGVESILIPLPTLGAHEAPMNAFSLPKCVEHVYVRAN